MKDFYTPSTKQIQQSPWLKVCMFHGGEEVFYSNFRALKTGLDKTLSWQLSWKESWLENQELKFLAN